MSTTKWALDASHSEVLFKVKHMVISTVTGEFTKFDAAVESQSDDFSDASFSFEAEIASINTKNADRDNHLKSADFFDAANYPKITFKSVGGLKGDEIKGLLNIRGIEKEITLSVEYGGTVVDPWGNNRSGFEISGKLSRKEFGLAWNQVTEAGGIVVSDEVKLIVNLEFIKQ